MRALRRAVKTRTLISNHVVKVIVRTNDLLHGPSTGSSVIIRQVLVGQDVHTDGLVKAFRRVMYVNL